MMRTIDLIDEHLRRLGLSTATLSERTGLPQSRFSKWRGSAKTRPVGEPTVAQLIIIARALGMSVSEFLGDADDSSGPSLREIRAGLWTAYGQLGALVQRLTQLTNQLEAMPPAAPQIIETRSTTSRKRPAG